LAATKDDPFLIFVRGTLAPNPFQAVAIIGTREPTEHGQAIAQRIAQYFAERGWSIVSGPGFITLKIHFSEHNASAWAPAGIFLPVVRLAR
jgi:hypothetical protein